jgi:hypothetical protein
VLCLPFLVLPAHAVTGDRPIRTAFAWVPVHVLSFLMSGCRSLSVLNPGRYLFKSNRR